MIRFSDVKTSLSGFARTNNGLRFLQDRNIILAREGQIRTGQVKLIAGGGVGHGPAFYGYVGRGMLDGAVCGQRFDPPKTNCIIDCLRMVAQPKDSVLFIINNYPVDRLHFGLAIERARIEYQYKHLEILVVDDDCAFKEANLKRTVGKRGLAGCVILIKLLGAMADLNCSLAELVEFGKGLLQENRLMTFGFTFEVNNDTLENVQLGKGARGEYCVRLMDCEGFDQVLQFMLSRMAEKIKTDIKIPVVLFVNNCGAVSDLHMNHFQNSLQSLYGDAYIVKRVYAGNFFTSRNMSGMSVTMVAPKDINQLLAYLDHGVQVVSPLFGGTRPHGEPCTDILNFTLRLEQLAPRAIQEFSRLHFKESTVPKVREILRRITSALTDPENQSHINVCGVECGVVQAGNYIADGARALQRRLNEQPSFSHPAKMLQEISLILETHISGNFGLIYGLFFESASKAFGNADADTEPEIQPQHWLDALSYGNEAIQRITHTEPGDRTMLHVLKKAEDGLRVCLEQFLPPMITVHTFAQDCRRAAEETRFIAAEEEQGSHSTLPQQNDPFEYPEPGALSVSIWANALWEAYTELFR